MNEKEKRHTERKWKQLFNYQSVVKQMPFFLFLTGLAVIYIYNGHHADRLNRDITRTSKELKELEYEYKTLKGEVLFQSKQSEMVKAVAPLGLKEMTTPPIILEDSIISK
jgi:hypothetical protein